MKKRGFTLIELILVLFIMSTILGIGFVKFNVINKYKAKKEIQTMINDIQYAKIMALTTGVEYWVELRPSSYIIKGYKRENPDNAMYTDFTEKEVDLDYITITGKNTIVFKATGSPSKANSYEFFYKNRVDGEDIYMISIPVAGGESKIEKEN